MKVAIAVTVDVIPDWRQGFDTFSDLGKGRKEVVQNRVVGMISNGIMRNMGDPSNGIIIQGVTLGEPKWQGEPEQWEDLKCRYCGKQYESINDLRNHYLENRYEAHSR